MSAANLMAFSMRAQNDPAVHALLSDAASLGAVMGIARQYGHELTPADLEAALAMACQGADGELGDAQLDQVHGGFLWILTALFGHAGGKRPGGGDPGNPHKA